MAKRLFQSIAVAFLLSAVSFGQSSSATSVDMGALTKETQQVDQRDGKIAMVWWIPMDFWEQSAKANGTSLNAIHKLFGPLAEYTVIVAGAGYVGVGGINWMPASDLRPKLTLRDQAGTLYRPVEKIAPETQDTVDMLKPTFKSIMGPLSDGMNFFFFPLKDANGNLIADPRRASEFSILVADVMGQPVSTYTWRLPLTALAPPKYCPVGKEKVQASWKYCPWHGNKLEESPAPPSSAGSDKPQPTAR